MFGTIRKHSQALWIPIIIVIVISFVVYFTPGFDPLDNRGNQQSDKDSEHKYARQQVLLEMEQWRCLYRPLTKSRKIKK